jgi:hypothetical protein
MTAIAIIVENLGKRTRATGLRGGGTDNARVCGLAAGDHDSFSTGLTGWSGFIWARRRDPVIPLASWAQLVKMRLLFGIMVCNDT